MKELNNIKLYLNSKYLDLFLEKPMSPRRMVSISRNGMRVRINSPVQIFDFDKNSDKLIDYKLRPTRVQSPVNLRKYGRTGMTLKELHAASDNGHFTKDQLPKIIQKRLAESRAAAKSPQKVELLKINDKRRLANKVLENSENNEIVEVTVKPIDNYVIPLSDKEIQKGRGRALLSRRESNGFIKKDGRVTTPTSMERCQRMKLPKVEVTGSRGSVAKIKETPTTKIGAVKKTNHQATTVTRLVEDNRKVFSYDKHGKIVELKAPPRLCYGYACPTPTDKQLRQRLIKYRNDRLMTAQYGKDGNANVPDDLDETETAESYMYRIQACKLSDPKKPRDYKPSHRDTGFTTTSSYLPWSVDIETIPTLSRYI